MIKKLIMISLFVFSFVLTGLNSGELIENTKNRVEKKGEIQQEDEQTDEETGDGITLVSFEVLEEAKEQMQ